MKKMKKKGNSSNGPEKRRKTLREKLTENKPVTIVYVVLRVLVMMVMVAQFFNGNFENVFLCVLTLFLFTLPSFIERTIRIDVPDTLEIIILLFIFSAEILGGDPGLLYSVPLLGHHASYSERLFVCGYRFFSGGYPQPQRTLQLFPFAPLSGGGRLLFFHDRRGALGVF